MDPAKNLGAWQFVVDENNVVFALVNKRICDAIHLVNELRQNLTHFQHLPPEIKQQKLQNVATLTSVVHLTSFIHNTEEYAESMFLTEQYDDASTAMSQACASNANKEQLIEIYNEYTTHDALLTNACSSVKPNLITIKSRKGYFAQMCIELQHYNNAMIYHSLAYTAYEQNHYALYTHHCESCRRFLLPARFTLLSKAYGTDVIRQKLADAMLIVHLDVEPTFASEKNIRI